MRPCVMMTEPEADAFELGFEQAWQRISEAVSRINTSEECGTCGYRDICQTCAASAYNEEGAFDAVPGYVCQIMQWYATKIKQRVENKIGRKK